MPEIPASAIYRIFKKAGAERVGEDAINEMGKFLEEYGLKVAGQSVLLATHAGRKTVKSEDIKLSIKNILESKKE
ncbi:MAG: histone family protein [Nitrososphaerota archaeon]|jgi:histone H3/H4|nr:histone family protein [Nitrososphaerota archaeon]MDG6927263.1 histone family protein [Nitrososphaerota archaeon]MDG6930379.1 histone family protein [Nitrososphaerota archaeon]MDG6932586.1 histone family protein [Nitrososphaerota archaeon]MDG6935676.1 histone family protein [Nitrososphaerota archaeon]